MKLGGCLPTVRAATGMKTARDQREALVWNVGTLRLDAKGDLQVVDPLGAEYRCRAQGRTGRMSDEAW
jgi:hypothetical protein